MGALNFEFSFPGKRLAAGFREGSKRIKDLRKPFAEAATIFEKDMESQFRREGRDPKWKPLKPKTIQDRLRQGFSAGPILTRSGAMRRSFTQSNATGHIREIERMRMKVGSNLMVGRHILAAIHTEGNPKGNLPSRPVLVIGAGATKSMFTVVARYIQDELGDAFKGLAFVERELR